jgi:hypothetical protein
LSLLLFELPELPLLEPVLGEGDGEGEAVATEEGWDDGWTVALGEGLAGVGEAC